MTAVEFQRFTLAVCLCAASGLPLSGATWNIRDFGATGDGTTDDTKAIQSTIDRSGARDTILFPAGDYRLTSTVNLKSQRTYQGRGGARILGANAAYAFATAWNQSADIVIDQLTIDTGTVAIQGDKVPGSNIQITNCTFQNIGNTEPSNWTVHWAVFAPAGLINSTIDNNTFRNILWGGEMPVGDTPIWPGAIWIQNAKNTSITNNTCDTVAECIYMKSDQSDSYPGLVLQGNTGTRIHRMGIEMQLYNSVGVQISGNTFSDFLNPYPDTFGISFASGSTNHGAVIENNSVTARPSLAPITRTGSRQYRNNPTQIANSEGSRYGYGIEAWGANTVVRNNQVIGEWTTGIAVGESTNISVSNNRICISGHDKVGYEPYSHPGALVNNNNTASPCQ